MESITMPIALIVLIGTIILLVKKFDTRTVLIASGILLCCIALKPLDAFNAFSSRMITGSLIQAICSSMGFAFVMKYTKCDAHLVKLLTGSISKLGVLLVPLAVIITFFISIAIPSAAGVSAAVGTTLIPLMIASRIHPATAAGAIITGTVGAALNPGVSHNAQVAGFAKMNVMDLVSQHAMLAVILGLIGAVSMMVVCIVRKEMNLTPEQIKAAQTVRLEEDTQPNADFKVNILYAIAPFIPVVLLVLSSLGWLGSAELNVPAAMILGAIYALILTRSKPKNVTKEFFNGMGSAYANIMGIIIAAAVFIEGLSVCGVVTSFLDLLTNNPSLARWGGTIGPFVMAVVTGSGDAIAISFNEAVTKNAAQFGFEIAVLGPCVMYAGVLGRNMSPLAGATLVCSGLSGAAPMEIIKRTAPGMILSILFVAIFWL